MLTKLNFSISKNSRTLAGPIKYTYMSLNKVMLIGNLGRDPEIRHLESGVVNSTFTLAEFSTAYNIQSFNVKVS